MMFIRLFNEMRRVEISGSEQEVLEDYLSHVISKFTQIFLLRDSVENVFLDMLEKRYFDTEKNRLLEILLRPEQDIETDVFCHIAYLMDILAYYYSLFYAEYHGKIEISEAQEGYAVNILYEVLEIPMHEETASRLMDLTKQIVAVYSDKASCVQDEKSIQFKMNFKKQ